ncbi:Pentatricopeptide repeat-containing protein At2g20540 [Linum grandiflorum]
MTFKYGAANIRELEELFVPILRTCRSTVELKKIHAHILKRSLSQSNFLATKMVDACDAAQDLEYATLLFKQVSEPNGFLYNAMIRTYTHNSLYGLTITVYRRMLSELNKPISPDKFTFPFVVKACAGLESHQLGKQIHAHVFKLGPQSHVLTENALIDMYAKCDSLSDCHQVFDEMTERNAISWNSVISGHARLGQMRKARALFDKMPERTIVSWTAIVTGYSRMGSYADALELFGQMQMAGNEPDEISIVSVLPACAQLGALEVGRWIHMYCDRNGLLRKTNICNALMEMYAKCGCIDQARQLFDQMRKRDVISWSTMIGGLANHGKALEAINMFERMKLQGIEPNGITFLGLLSACAHAGLWQQGVRSFDYMRDNCLIEPVIEHFGVLVDLLGRAGRLSHALNVIEQMPMRPDSKIWGSLLSCCRTHGNLDIAVVAMKHLEELEPEDTGNYVLLSNIYADLGKWEGVSRMRTLIRSRSMKKTPGCSSIEINNVATEFSSGDDSKPFSRQIFKLLEMLTSYEETSDHVFDIIPEDGK